MALPEKAFFDKLAKSLSAIHGVREAGNITRLLRDHIRDHDITEEHQIHQFEERLNSGEPIHYVIGEAWFYKRRFYVDSNVLIPRPETEELVHWIINDHKRAKQGLRILDIGTGSGCIANTLAAELPTATVTGRDVSRGAVEVAMRNADEFGVNVKFEVEDFLKSPSFKPGRWDVIVSNPPYVTVDELPDLEPTVRDFEPHVALTSGLVDSLTFYRKIAHDAIDTAAQGTVLYVEMHSGYAEETAAVFDKLGYTTEIRKDINGYQRMLKAQM